MVISPSLFDGAGPVIGKHWGNEFRLAFDVTEHASCGQALYSCCSESLRTSQLGDPCPVGTVSRAKVFTLPNYHVGIGAGNGSIAQVLLGS